jgi:asparagine synthase (glutamine-hydrolysing)
MGMGVFSQYMVAKSVSKKFRVVLTGHGGDELFSGYPVFGHALNGPLGFAKVSEVPHYAYFTLSNYMGSIWKEYGRGLPVVWPVSHQKRLIQETHFDEEPWSQLEEDADNISSNTDQIFMTYLKSYLPGLLVVEDKLSMAHSMESRTPFLDNEIVDLSLRIPHRLKLHENTVKSIVRERAKSNLPSTFLKQPKRGFPTPLSDWFRHEEKFFLLERLTGRDSYLQGIFNSNEILKFTQLYMNSWRKNFRPLDEIQGHRMWQLLSIESWLRVWKLRYGVSLYLE